MLSKMNGWFFLTVTAFSLAFGMAGAQISERAKEDVDFERLLKECKPIECTLKPIEKGARNYGRSHVGETLFESLAANSVNWSGYVAVSGSEGSPNPLFNSVTHVSGAWVVPTLTANLDGDTYSSAWVGIDGYINGMVEQIGTEHDIAADGTTNYYAWVELYPQGPRQIEGFPVNPGDQIAAAVNALNLYAFEFRIANLTQGVVTLFTLFNPSDSPAHLSSAEWIVEAPATLLNSIVQAPEVCLNILPLANFTAISFSQCKTTINGRQGRVDSKHWTAIPMVMTTGSPDNTVKANPLPLSKIKGAKGVKKRKSKSSRFDVIWQNAGEFPYQSLCPVS